jgi:tetratricopeptide (TPR) repeat protein
VGKTALVIHWAHAASNHFEDGILYFDMGGFGPGEALAASDILNVCLRTFAVPVEQIPPDTASRAAMYRSITANKRLLVVIDNVSTEDQAQPLIPSSGSSSVVITSRRRLPGLAARLGAIPIVLEVLSPEHSMTLLKLTVSAKRVESEIGSAARLIERCSNLPLALRVLGQRIAEDPYCTMEQALVDLSRTDSSLDKLRFEGDELSDIRAVFSYSYNALRPEAAATFRLLGLYPVAEFSAAAVAALIGDGVAAARRQLERLVDANLISLIGQDRYKMHDLLRDYALELAEQEDLFASRASAVRRLSQWVLHAVRSAQALILPNFNAVSNDNGSGIAPPTFESSDSAIEWFERERLGLLAIVKLTVDYEQLDIAWRIAATIYPLLEIRHYWSDWIDISHTGIEAARRVGDDTGQARNFLSLGDALWLSGEFDQALDAYQAGTEHSRRAGDSWSEAFCQRQIGMVYNATNRVEQAAHAFVNAIPLFRAMGDKRGEAMSLIGLGAGRWLVADYSGATHYCQSALELLASTNDAWTVAWAKCALARAQTSLGQLSVAIANYDDARETFARFGNSRNEARSMVGLGEAMLKAGQREQAFVWFRRADTLLKPLKDVAAREVKQQLREASGANGFGE